MKKYTLFFLLFFVGCASINVPNYIKDDNPYRKNFEATYSDTLDAVEQALIKNRWTVVKSVDPALYERSRDLENQDAQQIMLITDVRQIGFILGTRYARLNIYLMAKSEEETEVEIRYLRANSIAFKTFYNYRHDTTVEGLFEDVKSILVPVAAPEGPTKNF